MKLLTLGAFVAILGLAASSAVAGTVIFSDTYETGPAGTPDLGSYQLFSGANSLVGDGSGTNQVLASTRTAAAGFVFQTSTQPTTSVQVDYDFRILSGATLNAHNAVTQQLILSPSPNNVSLWWGDDGHLWYLTEDFYVLGVQTPLTWAYDTDYHVRWIADSVADTVSIQIGGIGNLDFSVGGPLDLKGPFDGYKSFAFSGGNGTFTQWTDNLTVTDPDLVTTVPLPGAAWAGLALLGLLGAGRRRRRMR